MARTQVIWLKEGKGESVSEYRISLPWPPSNNRYYRHNRGRTHISTEGQAYRDSVARIIKTRCWISASPLQ
jgi:Holliday junction resolvase RusA-like endonuclease